VVLGENSRRRALEVTAVSNTVKISRITEGAWGAVMVGDVLVAVERDDVSKWRLRRLRQRLNDFRVPVGRAVCLTFKRRVLRPEQVHQVGDVRGADSDTDSEDDTPPTPLTPSGSGQAWGRTNSVTTMFTSSGDRTKVS
jgi:hypothetical protein